MKPLLLRQRGKLRLSSNVSLPSHPHQAVNVLATPEMFQFQAGTPGNNPVLLQVDSFVTVGAVVQSILARWLWLACNNLQGGAARV